MRTLFRVQILQSALVATFVVIGVSLLTTGTAAAHGEDETSSTYTAEAGDSQTIFARDAINHYAKEKDIKLTDQQRVYAETNLVKKMGDRYLEIGEKVVIAADDVKNTIDSAEGLSAGQRNAWQPYAETVDYSEESLENANQDSGETSSSSTGSEESDDKKTADKPSDDKKGEESKDESSPWYKNVFTWILIVAAAIILWSLFASRKEDR